MNKIIYALVFLLSFVLCFSVSAHKDRIITIKNGELVGLPEKYQPAYFDVKKNTLRIGTKQLKFPPCVSKYFPDNNQYKIQITSSWYHDVSLLPPYLSISIKPKDKNYSFNLLFDMDTLKPLKFEIEILETDGVTSFHQLLISDSCQESIEKSYMKTNDINLK